MKTYWKIIYFLLFLCVFPSLNIFSQRWQSLGKGLDYAVDCFYTDSVTNLLYIGGYFRIADDSIITTGVATWDGLNFSPLGCGFDWNCSSAIGSGFYPGHPISIARYNSEIYAAGGFERADNKPIKYLAKWNGNTWDSVRSGVIAAISLLVNNNELYISGVFDNYATYVTKWDGTAWINFPNVSGYTTDVISDMIFYKNELYICGKCDSAGFVEDVYKWEGSDWKPVGNGIHSSMGGLNCFAVYKNELYVGGSFNKTEGNPGNNIVKWDGNNWYEVGGGVIGIGNGDSQIHDLIVYNDELYAGGVFSYAGGVSAKYIAKWDGTQWCGLGSYFDNRILALGVYQDMLYIGGGFWTIDGDSINSIAKWTGGSYVDTCSNTTSINEINNKVNNITLYPNPVTENATIQLPVNETECYNLQVFDIEGRLVMEEKNISGKSHTFKVSGLNTGVYVVEVVGDRFMGRVKLIIQ